MGYPEITPKVPLDDSIVKQYLRERSQPICLFGEDAHDRRNRLRTLMSQEDTPPVQHPPEKKPSESSPAVIRRAEDFYVEGPQELKQLRLSLAKPSLIRAARRLEGERNAKNDVIQQDEQAVLTTRKLQLTYAQVADGRPLSAVAIGHDEKGYRTVVTGGWGGNVVVRTGDCSGDGQVILEHSERISAVSIPRFKQDVLLTASADCTACLFAIEEEDMERAWSVRHRFKSHTARVTDAKLHPFRHELVATSSFDGTFGLHDDGKLVQKQTTGHSKVYKVNFHPDGSLLGTCGLEGGLRIWDMRSGRAVVSIPTTQAHEGGALGLEFSGNGTVWATCGMDNMIKMWDLRRNTSMKSIAGHRALVSGIRFAGGACGSEVLFSSSYDQTVKCWSASRNWGLIVAFTSHNEKVTGLDCTGDGKEVVSSCYDKMCRLWTTPTTLSL